MEDFFKTLKKQIDLNPTSKFTVGLHLGLVVK